jgi:uncharacterized protein YkwD
VRLLAVSLALFAISLLSRPARAEDAPKVPLAWAAESRSPQPADVPAGDAALHALCGERDLGLGQVASAVVARRAQGAPPLSPRAIRQLARAAGVPQARVSAWSYRAAATDDAKLVKRLAAWLNKQARGGVARCGVSHGMDADGRAITAVVIADALADLAPLATRAAASRWLRLEATMNAEAEHARVVLLGPRGRPKRVLTSLGEGVVRSRFMLDQPGRWLVQVVATLETGPEPVLEVEIYVEGEPPADFVDERAEPGPKEAAVLVKWLNAARKREGVGKLVRDKALDAVARAHAAAMLAAGRVGHDVGDGGPEERADAAGIKASRVGENVARAPTLARVHAVLWDSPSHRENMLDGSFRRVGVAAIEDARGRFWSVQVFAN